MTLTDTELLNANILIVDDQLAHVHLLERLLRDTGYVKVATTIDPQEVCALHRKNHYDLILLDLQMPLLDGFGVMEGLQVDAEDGVLPVIALTAQPGHKLRALQAGARDFINKPFDIVEVKLRIRHMLEVRLLYKMLEAHSHELEDTVRARTAELRQSEERFRRLTELASDWYWEQNERGTFTQVSGPVFETLGMGIPSFLGPPGASELAGWDETARAQLQDKIAARQPFLDFAFSRIDGKGARQYFRVSGEPMFDEACRFTGYRGIGAEVGPGLYAQQPLL